MQIRSKILPEQQLALSYTTVSTKKKAVWQSCRDADMEKIPGLHRPSFMSLGCTAEKEEKRKEPMIAVERIDFKTKQQRVRDSGVN